MVQNNSNSRYICNTLAHVSSELPLRVPPKPPEPPDTSTHGNGSEQWYWGFLYMMSGMANFIMTVPLQIKRNVGHWATKVRTYEICLAQTITEIIYLQLKLIKVDNNGIKPTSPEWDKGISTIICTLFIVYLCVGYFFLYQIMERWHRLSHV